MNAKAKLLARIRGNPTQVRFEEACKCAGLLGFVKKGGAGSHCTFVKPGETRLLNFQNRDGFIPNYQAKQLALMIDKYGKQHDPLSH